jgi:hypothetical protein
MRYDYLYSQFQGLYGNNIDIIGERACLLYRVSHKDVFVVDSGVDISV